jgi:hypothetical protein
MAFRECLTDRDHEALQFVESYGSITIEQCRRLFYSTQKRGYDIAGRRLGKMVKNGRLKVAIDKRTKQNVYYLEKPLSTHNLYILDFFTTLIENGAKILFFNRGIEWQTVDLKSDAMVFYEIGNKKIFNILEVVVTHEVEKEKYKKIFETQEIHLLCNEINKRFGAKENINYFPKIVVIDEVNHTPKYYYDEDKKYIQLNFDLEGFPKIFL